MKEPLNKKRNLRSRLTIGGLAILVLAATLFVSGCTGNSSGNTPFNYQEKTAPLSSPFANSIIGIWGRNDQDGTAIMGFDRAGMVKLAIRPIGEDISSVTGTYRFIGSDYLEIRIPTRDEPGYYARIYRVISVSDNALVMEDQTNKFMVILEKVPI